MNVLAVYNCCQIRRANQVDFYVKAIQDLLVDITGIEAGVCVQGTMMTQETKRLLQSKFGNFVSFVWVDENLPLNITFNLAVKEMLKRKSYSEVLYLDSGIDVGEEGSKVKKLAQYLGEYHIGCVAAVVQDDGGYEWLKVHPPKPGEIEPLPVGKTVNMHCQMWTTALLDHFPHLLPDIFASDCSEQVTPYLCAAVGKKFILSPIVVHHEAYMDGASCGQPTRGSGWECKLWQRGEDVRVQKYAPPEHLKQLCTEGHKVGWGFEEFMDVSHHDPSKFDKEKLAIGLELRDWLRDNMFLKDFDYESIAGEVVMSA